MKKLFLALSFAIVVSAFALSYNAVTTAQSGDSPTTYAAGGTIQFETVATLPASTDLTFTPESDGTLKIFYINIKNYFANYLYYGPDGEGEIPEDDSFIYQNPFNNSIYPESAGTQFEYNLTAGTTYYLYNTSELQYYAVFVTVGGGDTDELVEIELDQATTIPVDQKGIFHCGFTGQLQVEAVTNMGTLAGQKKSFLFTDEDCTEAVPVVSSIPGAYFDTFVYNVEDDTDYYVYYDDPTETSITYTFTNIGSVEVPEVKFDESVQYVEGTDYLIAVEGDCQIAIETQAALGEQELMYGMIYYMIPGTTSTRAIRDYSIKDGDNFNTLYIYTLSGAEDNIYYFSCKNTAYYTFSIYTAEGETPSEATARITNPLTNVRTFGNFVIVWDNYLPISNGSLLGATITGPDNETYKVTRYTVGAADDNHQGDNSLSLSFDPYAEANGTYTITLPQGVVYIDGMPNKEQTLTFVHEWTPDLLQEGVVLNEEISLEDTNATVQVKYEKLVTFAAETFEIVVKFDGTEIGTITDPQYITLTTEDETQTLANVGDKGNVLNILLSEAGYFSNNNLGTYTIEIPEGLVEDDGFVNPAQTVTVTSVDVPVGVTGIAADGEGVYRVYNINGVNICNTNDANNLKNLPAGFYIINGKKVVL